jgi:hypothetical protein
MVPRLAGPMRDTLQAKATPHSPNLLAPKETLCFWKARVFSRPDLSTEPTLFPSGAQVLKFLSSLAPYLGGIEKLLMEESIPLRGSTFETFIIDTALLLANLGISVALPRELKKVRRFQRFSENGQE